MQRLDYLIPAIGAALLLCAPASRAADAAWEPLEQIRAAAHLYAETHSLENSSVTVGALDTRLRLPACGQVLEAQASGPARGSYTVAVHCSDASGWTVYVPVKVDEHLQVLVLRRSLARGEKVTPDHVELKPADSASTAYGYLTVSEQAIGKIAKRPLLPGAVLRPDALEAPRAVVRGQRVTLLGKAGAIEVHAEGKALNDAAEGERVRVENSGSRRVVEGVARGGMVEVTL